MSTILGANDAFDRALEPVINLLSREQAEQIVDYHADEVLKTRIEELTRKANEGELTDGERAEYEGYAQANRFIKILQGEAQRLLMLAGDRPANGPIDLAAMGINEDQAANLRRRFEAFAEDWERPEMDVYDVD